MRGLLGCSVTLDHKIVWRFRETSDVSVMLVCRNHVLKSKMGPQAWFLL